MERPYTLVAEVTYRCPLRCAYCSNPLDYARRGDALGTATWQRVFAEAEALGVVTVNLTGGEPLLRADLEDLVASARALDLYVNLITSGIPLDRARLARLAEAGLDSVQLSIQDAGAAEADRMAGARAFERKLEAARWVRALGLPLTINTVLHRDNLARVGDVIALAESLGAERLELANAQYLGWALANRQALLPSRAALESARAVAAAARRRLAGRMEIVFVTPDYYAETPKACMDGWARRFIVVTPDGLALPCHAAHTIPRLQFPRVTETSLGEIWRDAPGFNAFRGEEWMAAPCRECPRRSLDYGGCRCQAFHLLGDAAATDPACALSPRHTVVVAARECGQRATPAALTYRSGRAPGAAVPSTRRPASS